MNATSTQEIFDAMMKAVADTDAAHKQAQQAEHAARVAHYDAIRAALAAYEQVPNAFKKGDKVKIPNEPKHVYAVVGIQMFHTSHGLVATVAKWIPGENRASKTHHRSVMVTDLQRA